MHRVDYRSTSIMKKGFNKKICKYDWQTEEEFSEEGNKWANSAFKMVFTIIHVVRYKECFKWNKKLSYQIKKNGDKYAIYWKRADTEDNFNGIPCNKWMKNNKTKNTHWGGWNMILNVSALQVFFRSV